MDALIPIPRVPIAIRPATLDDLPFIDSLQKKHTKQVGWFPTKTIEGKIARGQVLVAEESRDEDTERRRDEVEGADPSLRLSVSSSLRLSTPVGYVIGHDQYFKRDDVGIIYQLNVVPGRQRGLIGATLLKAMFDRAAWGCRLFCCWCAQDIQANYFWEALGFVPLAYRAGSETKRRVHIFWCKRIRQGDTTTPWWFPSQTMGGAMMEDRLVFPIPPGTHWSDAKPIVLPGHTHPRQLEDANAGRAAAKKIKPALPIVRKREPLCGGLRFQSPEPEKMTVEKPKRQRKTKIKNDPMFVSAARELRDRWLERVNSGQCLLETAGKYEVSKTVSEAEESRAIGARLEVRQMEAKRLGYQAASIAA